MMGRIAYLIRSPFEEWKLLASIIGRLEEVEYKIRSWLVTLITALAVALYSKRLDLSVGSFALIGIILIIIFVWMDLIHRMPKRNAIKRAREIEEILREGRQYDGPKMSLALATPRPYGMLQELWRMAWTTPYLQFLILVILLSLGYLFME